MTATPPRTIGLALVLLAALSHSAQGQATDQSHESSDKHAVQVVMKNVMYHYSAPTAVHIVKLQGQLVPAKPDAIVVFDDLNSFTLVIASGEISISCDSLAQVLNQNVLSSKDAPIKDLTLENKKNQLMAHGKLKKGDVPFEMAGTLSVNGDGRIRLHAEHIKAVRLSVKGLMDLLGVDLSTLIGTKKVPGLDVEKDDLIIDPQQILPPPHIQGKITAIRLAGNDLVQVFGSPQASNFAAKLPGNYMAYREGDLRFGKMTMNDVDLTLTDMDPSDAFDFYIEHYKEQIVAGYVKMTPQLGLRVYMRDYNKLRPTVHSRSAKTATSQR
jgi:hypothetical protein